MSNLQTMCRLKPYFLDVDQAKRRKLSIYGTKQRKNE